MKAYWKRNKGTGELPVPEGTPVEVLHRDGGIYQDVAGSGYAHDWSIDVNNTTIGDIMKWRLFDGN